MSDLKRLDSLPPEFIERLRSAPRERVKRLLLQSITERATQAELALNPTDLAAAIEDHDERYFTAHETGRDEEALRCFRHARLLEARQFLLSRDEDDAIYEWFHSLDDAAQGALLRALQTE